MIFETGEKEQSRAKQEYHHGGRCLILTRLKATTNNDVVQSFQLAG